MVYSLLLIFVSNMLSFCSKHKHFLLTLLTLEILVLIVFIMIFFCLDMSIFFFSLIFITFSACEGALGISILVDMSRRYGSDFISLLSFSF